MEGKRICVYGAGLMGHGIAQVVASKGFSVALRDRDEACLEKAMRGIRSNLDKQVAKGKIKAEEAEAVLARIRPTMSDEEALVLADVVIEAVPERLEVKRSVLAEAEAGAPAGALLASNTSSLSITELQSGLARPGRMLGLHFFNPVHINRLVEVVRGARTDESAVADAVAFARRLGKEPIVVADSPGFASTRLGVLLGLEAMRMVEEGVASPEAIDAAMELGYRHPMGPLKLTDLVGLDVRLDIATYLHERLGERFRPPEILKRMVAEGKLGRKTGQGFYRWEE